MSYSLQHGITPMAITATQIGFGGIFKKNIYKVRKEGLESGGIMERNVWQI